MTRSPSRFDTGRTRAEAHGDFDAEGTFRRLTKPQKYVMRWMSQKWHAYQNQGTAIEINGTKVCTRATIDALERLGLIECSGHWSWKASISGRALRDALLAVG